MPTDLSALLSSFSGAAIFWGIMYSIVGFAAWRYGRKASSGRHMLLGVALMAYGYVCPNAWLSFFAGALLTTLLFWP